MIGCDLKILEPKYDFFVITPTQSRVTPPHMVFSRSITSECADNADKKIFWIRPCLLGETSRESFKLQRRIKNSREIFKNFFSEKSSSWPKSHPQDDFQPPSENFKTNDSLRSSRQHFSRILDRLIWNLLQHRSDHSSLNCNYFRNFNI